MSNPAAIVVITQAGMATARKIRDHLPGSVIYGYRKRTDHCDVEFDNVGDTLRRLFTSDKPIIALMSAGIVIRTLGNELKDKLTEPPVLTVAEDGRSIVPLLGGHHGANDLARTLAAALGGHPAFTTTGDTRLGIALDSPPRGWHLLNPQDYKAFAAQLLAGDAVQLHGKLDWLSMTALRSKDTGRLRITETVQSTEGNSEHLVYHPAKLAVGVGCERGTSFEELEALVFETLQTTGLSPMAVAGVFSLDLKSDEPAIHKLADRLNTDARFFDAETLEREAPRLANPSDVVYREVGCHGVAEGAALAAAGSTGQLVAPKAKSTRATCAVAESRELIDSQRVGCRRGHLLVLGLGPGDADSRSSAVTKALEQADDLVGFQGYLDLVESHPPHQTRHGYRLGEETDRVRDALALAATGRRVALVCSGDPGVYAMATLVFELAHKAPDTARYEGWSRIQIEVLPGVSAMQTAAARIGAPLGHDFCAISLSDLLTPWPAIENRIKAAAEGDFVVAFYNPRSKSRVTQLERAITILRDARPTDTPVVVARNLGRDGESTTVYRLDDFDCGCVDMLSIVLVGASTTEHVRIGETDWVYTPRGYDKKNKSEVA